jgi:hypothetical protein
MKITSIADGFRACDKFHEIGVRTVCIHALIQQECACVCVCVYVCVYVYVCMCMYVCVYV